VGVELESHEAALVDADVRLVTDRLGDLCNATDDGDRIAERGHPKIATDAVAFDDPRWVAVELAVRGLGADRVERAGHGAPEPTRLRRPVRWSGAARSELRRVDDRLRQGGRRLEGSALEVEE